MNPSEIQEDIRKLEAMGLQMKGNPSFAPARGWDAPELTDNEWTVIQAALNHLYHCRQSTSPRAVKSKASGIALKIGQHRLKQPNEQLSDNINEK